MFGLTRHVLGGACIAVLFSTRAYFVGWTEALAEAFGVASHEWYIRWRLEYRPLHRALFSGVLRPEWLHPAVAAALANQTHRSESLRAVAQREGDGVFSVPLLRPDFCRLVVEEVEHFAEHFARSGHSSPPPNSMNDYGVVLDELGLGALMSELRERVLRPMIEALYSEGEPAACAAHHGFTVRYEPADQAGLDMHHDDSEYTLNVCLYSEGVRGSGLSFCGLVGEPDHRRYRFTLTHRVGVAVLHVGRHRHGADDLTAGVRQNLILWGRRRAQQGSSSSEKVLLHPDEEPPDPQCLSWTHDADYTQYRPLSVAALKRQHEREQAEELMRMLRDATDEHIAKLPIEQQPFVRLLKQVADSGGGD